jgi:glycosyltransferase involved in cell wall biosynthesis
VLAQDRQADEIIVVDDGSTDNGAAAVEKYPTIKLLQKPNGGQSSARNVGVAASTSDLIAFLDQDDVWYPQHLRKLAEPFEDVDANLGWSYSDLEEIDATGGMVRHGVPKFHANEHPKRSLQSCLGQDMHVLPSASLVSREAFFAVGGFDEQLIGYEDDDLFLRIFRAGFKNAFVDEPLSKWRMDASSTSFSRTMFKSRRVYFNKLISQYPDNPAMVRYYTRDIIAPRFTRTAFGELVLAIYWNDNERFQLAADQVQE